MSTFFNAGLAYSEYRQKKAVYLLAAIVAFTMSSYFVVGYLAGDLLFWNWDIAQTMNGGVGVGLCAVLTGYQTFLYSKGDVTGGKKATVAALCVAVGFSLLSEIGQGMDRDHVRMEARSLESPTYKAIVGQIGSAAGVTGHPYSSRLSTAQMKLARCQQKVSAGIWTDCVESTARLTSVQNMIQGYYQQHQQHSMALANTAKTMEKDESNYHPLVNLIKGGLGTTGVVASFVLSLVLISFFEYAFHYLGRQLAEARALLLSNGYDVTRRNRKTPKALARMQDEKNASPADNTWNDQLAKSGLDAPEDDALNQAADPAQSQRIIDRGMRVKPVLETHDEQLDMGLSHAPLHAPHARVGTDAAYQHASDAPVGSDVNCPQCGAVFKKKNQQHRFCKKQHRFDWHNEHDPKRQDFLAGRNGEVMA